MLTGDSLRGLMGRINSRQRQAEALEAALHIIEALWCSAPKEARERAARWTGWASWLEAIKRAVDWG